MFNSIKDKIRLSTISLLLVCSLISIYRINVVRENEMAWDVLGYYMYLPATFIHHDPMLNDITWLEKVNEERKLTGTLYMVSQNAKGEPMYFFLMGMSFFYLPFFLAATLFAWLFGFPVDGFSIPYQYFMSIGGIVYTIIGLIFLRKILMTFFSEAITALLLLLLIFGTNAINHLTIDNLGTVNIIFMLTTIIIWQTIKWHETYSSKHITIIFSCVTLITLVKPSEIFVFLIPLLWNVTSADELKEKIKRIASNKTVLLYSLALCLLFILPQLLYWYIKTGKPIYDSYKNPGIGLDFLSPHILNVLFSYRKGWLLYTPLMIFALTGFYFLYKRNKAIVYACGIYFLISFYIIASWTEWWYGAAFSSRPMIATYPVLMICLGYFLDYIKERKVWIQLGFTAMIAFFIFLNQFQWWQLKNYILDPYRTTKEYYWAIFLKTSISEADTKLLMVYRDFTGSMKFKNQENYHVTQVIKNDFEGQNVNGNQTEGSNHFYRFDGSNDFCVIVDTPFDQITQKDHVWVKFSIDVRFPESFSGDIPYTVCSMDRKQGSYGYYAPAIQRDSLSNQWRTIEITYMTPEIRNVRDKLKCYIWKNGAGDFDIDNAKVEIFEKK